MIAVAIAGPWHQAAAAEGRDILVHANALVCKDVDSLTASVSAWRARNEEIFRAHQESGACFLTTSTAKGRLLVVRDEIATIAIDFFLMRGQTLEVDAERRLWAMVGTYSTWPENWQTQ